MSKIYVFDKEDGKLVGEVEGNVSSTPLVLDDVKRERIETGQWRPNETYSANFTMRMNKKMRRFLGRHRAFHNGFERQMAVLRENPKHLAVIYRCSRYGDRIPHKYRVMYPEVIRAKNVFRCSRQMKRL